MSLVGLTYLLPAALLVTATLPVTVTRVLHHRRVTAETVLGVLAKLDAEALTGRLALREVREGRSEVVQMWGRPESVRQEFRQRRGL